MPSTPEQIAAAKKVLADVPPARCPGWPHAFNFSAGGPAGHECELDVKAYHWTTQRKETAQSELETYRARLHAKAGLLPDDPTE